MINNKKITVVYFAYLLGKWGVFLEQLKLVQDSGLYDDTDNFYLCATIKDIDIPKLYEIINKYPKITLYYHGPENTYEYQGLKCFYETAEDNAYSFYFHTKSIFNDNPLNIKIRYILHKNIIMNYKDCVSYLDSGYTKVSCFKPSDGFCWFNFFWATGSFIKTLDIPIKTPNRYDYEVWATGDVDHNYATLANVPLCAESVLDFCRKYVL